MRNLYYALALVNLLACGASGISSSYTPPEYPCGGAADAWVWFDADAGASDAKAARAMDPSGSNGGARCIP